MNKTFRMLQTLNLEGISITFEASNTPTAGSIKAEKITVKETHTFNYRYAYGTFESTVMLQDEFFYRILRQIQHAIRLSINKQLGTPHDTTTLQS